MNEIMLTQNEWNLLKQVMAKLTLGFPDASFSWYQLVKSVDSRMEKPRVELVPDSRDAECVKRWPECESGCYDPRCCRFPKSCSCG